MKKYEVNTFTYLSFVFEKAAKDKLSPLAAGFSVRDSFLIYCKKKTVKLVTQKTTHFFDLVDNNNLFLIFLKVFIKPGFISMIISES